MFAATTESAVDMISRTAAFGLFFALAVNSRTTDVFTMFGLREYEEFRITDMAWNLLQKAYITLTRHITFIGIPFVFMILRKVLPKAANMLQFAITITMQGLSIVALPLCFFLPGRNSGEHPLGNVLVADFITMLVVHAYYVLIGMLPPWSFSCGPLFGLGHTLVKKEKPSTISGAIVAMYANVGALHRAYRMMGILGHDTLAHTLEINKWRGYELYSAVNVVGAFFIISSSIPVPSKIFSGRGLLELVEICFYIILVNANIGAAWLASAGIVRPSLIRLTPLTCLINPHTVAHPTTDAHNQRRARASVVSRARGV